ncbi:MAG: Hsp70 family protein [Candidatus Limnocylindrales bacterium]
MPYVLGVDLGTTYTAAAVGEGDRFEIAHLGSHSATIPSIVFLREDGELLAGDAAERRAAAEPARAGREFKRRLGDTAPMIIAGTPFSADALMARLLKTVIDQVTEERGASPERVAVTHPATYGEFRLELVRQIAAQAGIPDPIFISEPVAAALQYASLERVEFGAVLAVYDFGGGTFDAAVLRKTEAGFEMLGQPQGLERLGGIDFDDAVFEHVVSVIGREALTAGGTASRAAVSRLREEARRAKESLSADTETSIPVMLPGRQDDVRLTRAELEGMIRPRIGETVAALERCVQSAGLELSQIDRILLVGGSSRIPLVGQLVRDMTGRPVARDAHPKHAVALGAARRAGQSIEEQPAAEPVAEPVVEVSAPAMAVDAQPSRNSTRELTPEPAPERDFSPPEPAAPVPAIARSRQNRRALLAGAGVLLLAAVAAAAFLLSQNVPPADARAAQITDAQLTAGTLTVWFDATGFTPTQAGDRLVFYWDNAAPSSGTEYWLGSPATFQATPPSGATQICVAVLPASGSAIISSGNCSAW